MVVLYYTLPLGSLSDSSLVAELSVGVAILVGVITWQVGAIERATYPAIRATQALAVTAPLFLLFFASSYYILSADDTATFTESLSRSDALYLTVTIFATVGFGDISAQTESARLFVTVPDAARPRDPGPGSSGDPRGREEGQGDPGRAGRVSAARSAFTR